eukprot:scaffold6248_cov121-Isochrysis_galbana.AAC.2
MSSQTCYLRAHSTRAPRAPIGASMRCSGATALGAQQLCCGSAVCLWPPAWFRLQHWQVQLGLCVCRLAGVGNNGQLNGFK